MVIWNAGRGGWCVGNRDMLRQDQHIFGLDLQFQFLYTHESDLYTKFDNYDLILPVSSDMV